MKVSRAAFTAAAVSVLGILAMGSSCGPDRSALGQIRPGTTVFADLWDESADEGDQALIERKPSGLWVLDTSAPFRPVRGGVFDVEVRLDPDGRFLVVNTNDTPVGTDGDDCLAPNEPEHYAVMADTTTVQEQAPAAEPAATANDDCVVIGTTG